MADEADPAASRRTWARRRAASASADSASGSSPSAGARAADPGQLGDPGRCGLLGHPGPVHVDLLGQLGHADQQGHPGTGGHPAGLCAVSCGGEGRLVLDLGEAAVHRHPLLFAVGGDHPDHAGLNRADQAGVAGEEGEVPLSGAQDDLGGHPAEEDPLGGDQIDLERGVAAIVATTFSRSRGRAPWPAPTLPRPR